jgi:hypothetical protein
MVITTREQAICMFYFEEYNEKYVANLTTIIDDLEDIIEPKSFSILSTDCPSPQSKKIESSPLFFD